MDGVELIIGVGIVTVVVIGVGVGFIVWFGIVFGAGIEFVFRFGFGSDELIVDGEFWSLWILRLEFEGFGFGLR